MWTISNQDSNPNSDFPAAPPHRPVTVARERNPPWPLQTALRGPCGRGDGEVLREFGKAGDRHNLAGGNVEDVVGTANEVHLKHSVPIVRMFDLGLKHPLQLHMDTAPDPADGGRVPDELGVVVPLRGGAEMDARGPVFQWDGASIPVVSTLASCSGAAPLLVGWGQPQDRIHSPNESFGLDQFARAMAWGERILAALAD